jgi:hypothetical protein
LTDCDARKIVHGDIHDGPGRRAGDRRWTDNAGKARR